MDPNLLTSQEFHGLRHIRIPRYQNGFGFTLRHFIVYPPELYSEEGDADGIGHGHTNGVGQSRLHKVTEPVDTIFVKSVKENSSAAFSGLFVGDRIVSVNGETIVGKSYDQVVSLIQKTKSLLRLEVSPKQYDTLQLFYEEQAYRPETNQRPSETLKGTPSVEPLYYYPVQSNYHSANSTPQPNDYSYDNRCYDSTDYPRLNMSSSHSSHTPAQFFSHLPRPVPYKSSAVWSGTPERNGEPKPYDTSPSQISKAVQRPQPQAYYPFNHSFDKSTLWKVRERDEPNSGAKSADSILGESCADTAVYRSPLRSESMECLSDINTNVSSDIAWRKAGPGYRYSISSAKAPGSGTSQPSDYRNTMVVTMSSTNTGQSSRNQHNPIMHSDLDAISPATTSSYSGYENQIVDRIRRSCVQKEEFLKRPPNQPFQWGPTQQSPPFPKELYAQPQKFTKVPWPPANKMPAVTSTKQPLQSSVVETRHGANRNERRPKSKNITVISVHHSGPDSLSSGSSCRHETSNSDSWSPVEHHSESDNVNEGQKMCSETDMSRSEATSPSKLLSMYKLPTNRLTVVGSRKLHCDPPPDWKPDLATLAGYQKPQSSIYVHAEESTEMQTGSNETDVDVQNCTDNVILRKREIEPETENERLVRRVSYLKATSSPIDMERKSASPTSPVKSFDVMSCKSSFPSEGTTGRRRSMANKLSAEFFPKGRIYKLKQFFEDRTQPTASLFKFYVDSPTSEYPIGTPRQDKLVDVSEVIRDGKVHFKIRVGENKRSTHNRSWRQGWAQVRRSGCLYLSKERLHKETVTGSEESVIISVSIRDGVHFEPAEDYTKRKNVIRIRTSFVPDDESNFPYSLAADSCQNSLSLNASVPQLTIELLLQTEDANDLTLWLQCIQKQYENNNCSDDMSSSLNKGIFFGSEFCPKSKSFLTSLLPSPGTPVQTSSPLERSMISSGGPSGVSTLNPNAGVVNTASSPKVKTWKGKVAKQWKKVHDIIDTSSTSTDNKSSNYASLPPAGATFGINLENCPPGELNSYVPRVIEYSIDLVERKGIEMVGLYRIPGNNASVATLTERLNRGEDPNPEKDNRWLDVHVVASLIKSFLRRLPDPLLTNDRYPAFIQAADENEETCLKLIKELIRGLPMHNYETLKAVVMHLKRVAEKGEANKMDARNLAIVLGPTIVRTAGENFSSMVADMKNQCKIVEALVLHGEKLFDVSNEKSILLRQTSKELQKPIVTRRDESDSVDTGVPSIPPSSPVSTIENELKASLFKAAKRKVSTKDNPQILENQPKVSPHKLKEHRKPVDERGFIRSYAGLNEVTERRIRDFELETRAMLSRDDRSPNSSVLSIGACKPKGAIEDFRQQQLKVDDALRKAKDDLETEDIYDQIADDPSRIVHHRERGLGLCASSPGTFNLSNSSLSSSNSNSTAPSSLLTSSLPAWPTGNSRLGPVPFRNSMPPQSLPPKPPSITANSSLTSSFDGVSTAQTHCPVRRVNSFDRLQGTQLTGGVNEVATNFENINLSGKGSFKKGRRSDGTFQIGVANQRQLGGSLDSLKDINAENSIMGNSRIRNVRTGNEGSREDLSPRSSDGSDMVTTLTKTFDKKLQNLRNHFTSYDGSSFTKSNNVTKDATIVLTPTEEVDNKHENTPTDPNNSNHNNAREHLTLAFTGHNNFHKKGRRRHSLIERRKSSIDGFSKEKNESDEADLTPTNSDSNKTRENSSDVNKASKSKKLAKECRRRHSLSGATDILSLVFRGSEKLSVHRDSDQKKNKTLSSEALLSALKNASILESHV